MGRPLGDLARVNQDENSPNSKPPLQISGLNPTTQTALAVRLCKEARVISIPPKVWEVLESFSPAFTRPTFGRFALLTLAAILTTGARTVSNLVRTLQGILPGDSSSYRRVFSKRRWSTWTAGRCLAGLVIATLCDKDSIIHLCGDDTVDEHRGAKVYGKDCHRDAVRSTKTYTAYRWGHRWVTLSIAVRLPFAKRRWAMPVVCALYRSRKSNDTRGKRHKTPPEIMRSLLALLMRWFPDRRFRISLDGGYATHELASFAHHHRGRLTLVSRFYPDANLYELPSKSKGIGRPRTKGEKLPTPEQVVKKTTRRQRLTVGWYGGEKRRVEIVTGSGHWYKSGRGLVAIRWVYVRDLTGTHRDEYFFTTNTMLTPRLIIETYTERWSLEVTYEEARAYLGLGTTCCRSKSSVEREAPMIFGLYSLVVLLYTTLPIPKTDRYRITWAGKQTTTFSDVITSVRRWLWEHWVFETSGQRGAFAKIPGPLKDMLLTGLAPAA